MGTFDEIGADWVPSSEDTPCIGKKFSVLSDDVDLLLAGGGDSIWVL